MANHWYDMQGNPCYEIEKSGSKGKRPTTIRDARKFNYVPSVTTVLQVSAKPALTNWLQNQVLDAVLKLGIGLASKNVDQWKGMIIEQSRRVGEEAAKRGNELHNSLEKYYLEGFVDEKEKDFIVPVIIELSTRSESFSPEVSFASEKGYGGKVDLISREDNLIIDFKTKAKDNFEKQLAYDDHCLQLAAYREGLKMDDARCLNVFISTEVPGLIKVHEWTETELVRGLEMFHSLLNFWKLQNNYNSGF